MSWWSWALSAIGLYGNWAAGKKRRHGWVVLAGSEVLWIFYAWATRQWGFIVGAIAWGAMYVKNFVEWRRA